MERVLRKEGGQVKQKAGGSNRNWAVQELGVEGEWLTRSRPPVARRHPSVLKLQQFTGPVCPHSSVAQGKSSAFCGSVSNCRGHSRTVKSSAMERGREEDTLKVEARLARRPKTKAIMGTEGREEAQLQGRED